MTPPKSTNNHPIDTAANSIIGDGVRAMKGIDKRIQKNGKVRYRARARIKGHPPVTKTFKNLTTAKRWKRNTEAEIEARRYFDKVEAKKHTLGEAIDRSEFAKNRGVRLLWRP